MKDNTIIFVAFCFCFLDIDGCSLSFFRQSLILSCHLFSLFGENLSFHLWLNHLGIMSHTQTHTQTHTHTHMLSRPLFSDIELHPHLGFEVFGI